jgi:hypothetical protein
VRVREKLRNQVCRQADEEACSTTAWNRPAHDYDYKYEYEYEYVLDLRRDVRGPAQAFIGGSGSRARR